MKTEVGSKSMWRALTSLMHIVPHIAMQLSLLYSARRAPFIEKNGKEGIIREIMKVSQD